MHLVYVSREYGPITGGGIGTYVANVTRAMIAAGHRVTLVTDCVEPIHTPLLPPGLRVVRPLDSPPLLRGNYFTWAHEYSHRVLATLRALAAEPGAIDVIEFPEFGVEGFATIRAKRLLNEFAATKLVVKCHTPGSLLHRINEEMVLNSARVCDMWMEDYCVRHADLVTSPSQSLADYFRARVGRADIALCPYPVALPTPAGPRRFSPAQTKRVRFVGSIQVRKGVDRFISAARLVLEQDPTFQFELWGEVRNATYFGRDYRTLLEKNIPDALRDRIRFCGGVPYAQIPTLLSETCFCVLPSRWENWANICLEAMAMGCVVVASSRGGMAEMIRDGESGFVRDPDDPAGIARTLLQYHADPDRLHAISAAAMARAAELSEPRAALARIEANYRRAPAPVTWRRGGAELVSVVVPFYNQASYLAETLASIRASTHPNIEIVVVNDGSTDPEANRIFEELTGVVKVSKPNGGLGSARNAGIAAATGDFVLPLDADDLLAPGFIEHALAALRNRPELGYVSCHAQNFGAFESTYIPVGYVPTLMPFENTDGKCVNLYRRSVLLEVGGYDETLVSYEDWDLLLTLHARGIEGDVIPEVGFYYRRHFDSMVYVTANPRRVELIQYLMSKHRASWRPHADALALVLAGAAKELELRLERGAAPPPSDREPTRAQLFFGTAAECLVEEASLRAALPPCEWTLLRWRTPPGVPVRALRLDPAEHRGCVLVRRIEVVHGTSGQPVFVADTSNGFAGLRIAGTARTIAAETHLALHSTGTDPQILLPDLPEFGTDWQVTAEVRCGPESEVCYEELRADRDRLWRELQQCRTTPSALPEVRPTFMVQLFWAQEEGDFAEERSLRVEGLLPGEWHRIDLEFTADAPLRWLRFDPANAAGTVLLAELRIVADGTPLPLQWQRHAPPLRFAGDAGATDSPLVVASAGPDPQIILPPLPTAARHLRWQCRVQLAR